MSPIPPTITPSSTLLSRRIARSRESFNIQNVWSEGNEAAIVEKSSIIPHNKLIAGIRGFLPLPPITASPICTPTPSSIDDDFELPTNADLTTADTYITPPSPSESSPVSVPPGTPTWIATPPTPPPKPLRRSNSSNRTPQRSFTPSTPCTPFPASMQQPHVVSTAAMKAVKRSSSVPAYSSARLSSTTHAVFLGFMDTQIVQRPRPITSYSERLFESTLSVLHGDGGPEGTGSFKRHKRAGSLPLPSAEDEPDLLRVSGNNDNDLRDDPSIDGSWSDHSVDDSWETENHKDSIRRFHALKELLATEVGYLMDLELFVTVYLRNLPTIVKSTTGTSTFGRASASFATGPWSYSTAQLQATATSTSASSPDAQNLTHQSSNSSKPSRYVFTDHEVELLTRNAEDLLRLHEHFVGELRLILEPLGYAMDDDDCHHGYQHLPNLDTAIRIVSTKFATEASRFNAYQTFCAGHPEAMDILRKATQLFPVELEAFEQRCSSTMSDNLDDRIHSTLSEPPLRSSRSSTDGPSGRTNSLTDAEDRKRAMSLTSLDVSAKSLRARSSMHLLKDSIAFPTDSTTKRDSKSASTSSRRLAFSDYMIKPIQRICKYPLLLDQLLPSKTMQSLSPRNGGPGQTKSKVNVVVESAAQAMRHVATSVDEARRNQDIAIQSGLILTRISAGLQTPSTSTSLCGQALTSEFLGSLGTCVLSGSLDAMHYNPERPLGLTSSIKAKYLGAFLYAGGYMILVKVTKGKKYEPRHWFSLADFDVIDVEDDSAMVPCSFRLSNGEYHFELAAACQREKDAWLNGIRDATRKTQTWEKEPTPSFMFDDKGELLLPPSEDGHSEAHNSLPTIRSIPELAHISDTETCEPFFASLRGHSSRKKRRRYDSGVSMTGFNPKQHTEAPPPSSRRSSTASVKSIFGPISDTETVTITRSSPVARSQVDQELQDVISQSCLTARSYAFSHEEELFQVPAKSGRRSSRTNSTIGMVRLSKHESVRVPRRRATDSMDGSTSRHASPLKDIPVSAGKNIKRLSINSVPFNEADVSILSPDTPCSPYPSPPSTRSSSSHVSTLRTPIDVVSSTPQSTPTSASFDLHRKQSHSIIRNVKGLFQLRPVTPASPVTVIVSEPSQNSIRTPTTPERRNTTDHPQKQQQGLLNRWKKDSIRGRSKSNNRQLDRPPSIFEDDVPEKPYPAVAIARPAAPILS